MAPLNPTAAVCVNRLRGEGPAISHGLQRTRRARYREFVARVGRTMRHYFSAAAVLLVLAGGSASVALAGNATTDGTPPTFAGIESATTCVAGPTEGQSAAYELRWSPATDDVTPSKKIVYDIYQATTSGGEDFSSPTYTTRHGHTTFTTPPLPADTVYYFVVRARDRAGNRDSNKVERQGVNLCA
jgi:hypothetical protein